LLSARKKLWYGFADYLRLGSGALGSSGVAKTFHGVVAESFRGMMKNLSLLKADGSE
jgi:hypothetical protein